MRDSKRLRTVVRESATDRLRGLVESTHHNFSHVESFLAFAGFPRSGHTLIGSLITAHPDAVVAHELNALRYLQRRFDRRSLYGLIMYNDRAFAASGSQWTGFDYAVNGQWQGRYRDLRLIGDKKGGGTALLLHRKPQLLARLRRTVGVPLRFVVVTRHPLDNIARMAVTARGLEESITSYFERADAVEWLLGEADCFVLRHEDFVESPAQHLGRVVDSARTPSRFCPPRSLRGGCPGVASGARRPLLGYANDGSGGGDPADGPCSPTTSTAVAEAPERAVSRVDGKLDWVCIDGDHRYEAVRHDWSSILTH